MKTREVLRKKAVAGLLALAMLLTGACYIFASGSKVQAASISERYVTLTGSEEVDWDGESKSIPKAKGTYADWLFAGWFSKSDCTRDTAITDGSQSIANYAKFVKPDTLSIKAQVSTNTMKVPGKEKECYAIRFISSVESLDYREVGFYVTYKGLQEPIRHKTTTVYERIGSKESGISYEFSPKAVGTRSEYFITAKLAVENTEEARARDYTVTAFWVTPDGTEVKGASRCISFKDGGESVINITVNKALSVGGSYSATYGLVGTENSATSVEVLPSGSGNESSNVRVTLPVAATSLPSATKIKIGDAEGIYRNYYNSYATTATATQRPDTTWYKVDSSADEFIIASNADLWGLADLVNNQKVYFENKRVILIRDVVINQGRVSVNGDGSDISQYSWANDGDKAADTVSWPRIGSTNSIFFKGEFDGDGNTISGLYFKGEVSNAGLFGYTGPTSTLKNFRLEKSFILQPGSSSGNKNIGSVAGVLKGNLSNLYVGEDVYVISAKSPTGGICGTYDDTTETLATVSGCWFAGKVVSNAATSWAGGIFGTTFQGKLNIVDCLNTGTVSGNNNVGGIIGQLLHYSNSAKLEINITNSVSTGTVAGGSNVGAIIGGSPTDKVDNLSVTVKNVYAESTLGGYGTIAPAVVVTGMPNILAEGELTGNNAYVNTSLNLTGGVWQVAKDGKPELAAFSEKIAMKESEFEGPRVITDWYYNAMKNNGTNTMSANDFEVSTGSDMRGIAKFVNEKAINFSGKTICLTEDVDLNPGWTPEVNDSGELTNAPENGWTPIGTFVDGNSNVRFKGTFDGQGHTISGVYMNQPVRDAGLFGLADTNTAVIKNFKMDNSYIQSSSDLTTVYSGAVAGNFCGPEMSNIYVTENVTVKGPKSPTGGLIGTANKNGLKISNCWFAGNVYGTNGVGGIEGSIVNGNNTIENCLVTGKLYSISTGFARAGGFIGVVSNTSYTGTITIKNSLCMLTLNVRSKQSVGDAIGYVLTAHKDKHTESGVYTSNVFKLNGASLDKSQRTEPDTGASVDGTEFDADTYMTIEDSINVIETLIATGAWTKGDNSYPVPTALKAIIDK